MAYFVFERVRVRTLLLQIMILLTGLVGGPAFAKEFAPQGGDGGGFFREICPGGLFLVGTDAHTGSVVDQISITCASVNGDGSTGAQVHSAKHFGGPGGGTPKNPFDHTERPTTCGGRELVQGMHLLPGEADGRTVVRMITFICVSTTSSAGHSLDIGDAPFFPTIYQDCPSGEAAVGLQGRSGAYVDAVGLICGPFAKPQPGSVPPPETTAGGCSGLAGEELAICDEHNILRAKHGVPPLTWAPDLAINARDWVKACHTSKDANGVDFFCHQSKANGCGTDPAYHFGENLSAGFPTRTGKDAVDQWYYCELAVYDFNNPVFRGGTIMDCKIDAPDVAKSNPNRVDGHFTQVVWRASKKLGCAQNTCSIGGQSSVLWACEYDPPGNFNVNQPGVLNENVPRPLQGLAATTRSLGLGGGAQTTTAVISDVDLYDVPGGDGRIIGVLRQGETFPFVRCRQDDWCLISKGWVWGAFLMRSYSR